MEALASTNTIVALIDRMHVLSPLEAEGMSGTPEVFL
jgi:hypothetical protein